MSSDPVALQSLYRKRLIVCCDGTGQSASTGRAEVPTNVARMVQALKTSHIRPKHTETGELKKERGVEEVPQIVLYQTGIGADGVTKISEMLARAFGLGVDEHVLEAYCFIANNYEVGDELFLFGFSRGAFTARAIASLMCNAGLLKKDSLGYLPKVYGRYKLRRDDDESRAAFDRWMTKGQSKFRLQPGVTITVLGVWDTVASLGIPETWVSNVLGLNWLRNKFNAAYAYHDTSLPSERPPGDWRGYVKRAYQALSLEENRTSFEPILFRFPRQPNDNIMHGPAFQQCWFPGVHTDVGGGYERDYRDISDLSFAWMVDMCWPYLNFYPLFEVLMRPTLVEDLSEPASSSLETRMVEKIPKKIGWGLSDAHNELYTLAFCLGGSTARKPKQYYLDKRFGPNGEMIVEHERVETHEFIHASVRMRMMMKKSKDMSPWQPPSLEGFVLEKDNQGWKWVKTIKIKGRWQNIAIREWMPNNTDCMGTAEEYALLDSEDLQLLQSDEATKTIEVVKLKSKKWLWSLGGVVVVILGAATASYVRLKHLR